MTVERIAAPVASLLSVEDVRAHLRIDGDDEDMIIASITKSAESHFDGVAGVLGRALITQTWEARFDVFAAEFILPLPPLQSVVSVTYIDAADVEQTVLSTVYQVIAGGTAGGRVILRTGQSWPTGVKIGERDAVRVRFVAGYGDTADKVPAPIRSAALLFAGDLYERREATIVGISVAVNPAVDRLIAPYNLIGLRQ